MTSNDFRLGMKVRHRLDGKLGVVIFDCFSLCQPDHVLVEFDGVSGTFAVKCADLEQLEVLIPRIDYNKCAGCAFSTGSDCLRYAAGRMALLLSIKNRKRVPERIYPLCQSA